MDDTHLSWPHTLAPLLPAEQMPQLWYPKQPVMCLSGMCEARRRHFDGRWGLTTAAKCTHLPYLSAMTLLTLEAV